MKALVAGWFSFSGMGTTAGDLMSRDVLCGWLDDAGWRYDVAVVAPFEHESGVDWRGADPLAYDCVLFVCGPFGNGPPVDAFLRHFQGRRMIGVNLSMLRSLDEFNPFDLLLERDSDRAANPDLALAAPASAIPVVGVILAHPQKEYGKNGRHASANAALHRLTQNRSCAIVHIDTCLDPWNQNGFRSPAEIEAMIAHVDLVLTTRLHGMVLSLKNGVPPIVIDPVAGGAKLRRQADVLEWPMVFHADSVTDDVLDQTFEYCLTPEARRDARKVADRAHRHIQAMKEKFLRDLSAEN